MEKIEVDNKDRPIEDIIIEDCQVFVDPYLEADEQVCDTNMKPPFELSFLRTLYAVWNQEQRKDTPAIRGGSSVTSEINEQVAAQTWIRWRISFSVPAARYQIQSLAPISSEDVSPG